MRHFGYRSAVLATVLATYCAAYPAPVAEPSFITTNSTIAIRNLDQQIAQSGDQPGVEELLLARQRFLSDYEALVGRARLQKVDLRPAQTSCAAPGHARRCIGLLMPSGT